MRTHTNQKGVALLELLIGLAIISISLVALLGNYKAHLKAALATTETIKAGYLAEEGFEAMRVLRDGSWSATIVPLINGTSYFLYFNGSSWVTTTTPQYIDGFLRTITTEAVNRGSNDDIVTSGGTVDSSTRKLNVTVAWSTSAATTTKTLSSYLTNLFSN